MNKPVKAITIDARINGETIRASVSARLSLVDFLRQELQLTGTHIGCEHGVCGACTVLVDGDLVRACLMLAVQVDGCEVETIEGASESGRLADLQLQFHQHNALQCGFCTCGMLLTGAALLQREPNPSREQIREAISANICRCTGYQSIVNAIEATAGANSLANEGVSESEGSR